MGWLSKWMRATDGHNSHTIHSNHQSRRLRQSQPPPPPRPPPPRRRLRLPQLPHIIPPIHRPHAAGDTSSTVFFAA